MRCEQEIEMMSQHNQYINPIYARDFADPGILKVPNGYYAYASQGLTAKGMHNIQIAFSKDTVHWEAKADALPDKAHWANEQDYWAPHVIYNDGHYYLFYNAKTNFSGQGIGVAKANSPEGPFIDSGKPLIYGESYIHIDAYVFEDSETNRYWLCWGSCFQAIKLRELDASLLDFALGSETIEILRPETNHLFASLHEAAWIHRRFDPFLKQQFYYLFSSGSNAFGSDSYGIMVARSETLYGPYLSLAEAKNREDSVVLRGNDVFLNPGANALFTDTNGQDWLLYHAYIREGLTIDYETLRKTPRVLMLDALYYDEEGWPYVQTGSPSTTLQKSPAYRGTRI
jgi:arabinan endo-1,5-alpha-L-arabinosidase